MSIPTCPQSTKAPTPTIQLTVMVPVYNAEAYLQRCLDSLAAQNVDGIEFICVNDGSTDSSSGMLETLAARDSRFRIIHQENGGYGKAMNTALDAARGTYVGIVEPDDWLDDDMYAHLLNLAQQSSADIVKANYTIERRKFSHPNEKFDKHPEGACLSPIDLPEYLAGAPSIWSAIYRRAWLQEHQIRFSETPGASFQDLGFCIRTWLAARSITITHDAPYHYWEDNPVSSSRRMEDGAWAAYNELSLLTKEYANVPVDAGIIRSRLVQRIFMTLRADYRLRIRETSKSFLLKYSHLLNNYFPLETLDRGIFSKNEWFDIELLYQKPLTFPRRSKTRATLLQRIISYRKEANHHVFRFLGMTILVSRKPPQRKTSPLTSFSDEDLPYDLTVATVCWNALQFLPRCIESVQPLYNSELKVEHLFIDGASTDGTLEYLQQQLNEGRITRIISEPDNGLYDAMNKAIAHARGKVIVFINADDAICPEGTPACCEPILSKRAEYTAGQALCISHDTGKSYLIKPRIRKTLWRQPFCHQSMFCSTALLRRMGGFAHEKFRIGADTDLMRRLYIAKVPFEAVQKISAHFYTGGVSYSPAVRNEVFELMMHFTAAYCEEAKKRPASAVITLKHLRRYTTRNILQHSESPTLDDKTREQLCIFVSRLSQALPPFPRFLIRLHQQLLIGWYNLNNIFASDTNRKTHRLYSEISQLFVSVLRMRP